MWGRPKYADLDSSEQTNLVGGGTVLTRPSYYRTKLAAIRNSTSRGSENEAEDNMGLPEVSKTPQIYTVRRFEELRQPQVLIQSIYNMGFYIPTRFQQQLLPTALANPPQNIFALTHAHLANTVALVVVMMCRVRPHDNFPHVLYLSRMQERAIKVGKVANILSKQSLNIGLYTPNNREQIVQGVVVKEQIIIGDTMAIYELARLKALDLKKISLLIIDETDGIPGLYGYYNHNICQTIIVSTTYDGEMMLKLREFAPNAAFLQFKEYF